MLRVRQVVRNGKGLLVYALGKRCASANYLAAASHCGRSSSLNSSNSSKPEAAGASLSDVISNEAASSIGHGEVLRARKAPPAESSDPDSSSSSSSDDRSTRKSKASGETRGKKGFKESVKDLVAQFTKGSKVLWVDFKASRKASARKRAGESLTFQEDRQLRQVGRDLAKALPVLTVFSLPVAGYLAPAIGFIFPKTLLPPQFWSWPQRLHFMLEDAKKQEATSFPKLLQHLAMLAASPRPNSSPRQLQASAKWFWREGRLERLTRAHLIRLLKACNTVPPFKKGAAQFVPKSWLVSWLRSEAASISNDDLALRKEFYSLKGFHGPGGGGRSKSKLTAAEVLVLCWERGLLRSQHWPRAASRLTLTRRGAGAEGGGVRAADESIPEAEAKAMLSSLEEYLALYDTPSLYDTPRETGGLQLHPSPPPGHLQLHPSPPPGHHGSESADANAGGSARDHVFPSGGTGAVLPPSMLLHAPALLRITHCPPGSHPPLCHLRVEKALR